MDEQTTSSQPVEPTGPSQDEALPETTATEAVTQTTDEPDQQPKEKAPEPSEPSDDAQLAKWAEAKGVELDSDNAKKAAKMAMESEKMARAKARQAGELEKHISTVSDDVAEDAATQTGQDPELLKRLQRVEVKEAVRDFWNTPDDSGTVPNRAYESKMVELLQQRPHLAGDLESLYATAVMKSGGIADVRSQGKREALESLAHKQQAAVPTGAATNSGVTTSGKPFDQLSISEMEAKLGFARR